MNKEDNLEEEEIIAYLLGEVNDEKRKFIEEILEKNSGLRQKKEIFAQTIGLIESSIPEPAVIPEENDLILNDEKKSAILTPLNPEVENTKKEGSKKQINYLFWVPLGMAACALLILKFGYPPQGENSYAVTAQADQTDTAEEKNKEIDEDSSIFDKKLQNQIQEGINQELIERTTQDILAMNAELKEIPNFRNEGGDEFPRKSARVTDVTENKLELTEPSGSLPIEMKDTKETTNAPAGVSKSKLLKKAKSEKNLKKTESTLASIFAPKEAISNSTALGNNQTKIINSSRKIKSDQSDTKSSLNGFELISQAKAAYLFDPKVKALGEIKITNQKKDEIKFVRIYLKNAKHSSIKGGENYQIRISNPEKPVIILVGNLLEQKITMPINEDGNSTKLPADAYTLKIETVWTLDEEEIRKPYDLKDPL